MQNCDSHLELETVICISTACQPCEEEERKDWNGSLMSGRADFKYKYLEGTAWIMAFFVSFPSCTS